MKSPCSKDCKSRKADCHDTCPAYRLYHHNQLKEYRKRRLIIDSSGDSSVKQKFIINKIKGGKY